MDWQIYLSGEIHSDWRERIVAGAAELPVLFSSPVTDHAASDAAGDGLGEEREGFWRDHRSAKVNAIRARTLIEQCDVAVIRFGEFAGERRSMRVLPSASHITLHDVALVHALKE